jgi:Mlc titration factor MtfA (ptsG expression regulator)
VIGEINLTKASKVLLLSPMAQISFGYRENVFLKVSKIKVYSGPFRLGGRGVAIKGAYHPQGILMYSWPDFLKGFDDYNDNFNLGLHECAHVLKFYLLQNKDYNDFIKLKLSKYKVQAQIVFAKMHQDSESFLRQYAKVNMHEFFAVCVEHFYENPFNFKENLPDLYLSLKKNTQDRFD